MTLTGKPLALAYAKAVLAQRSPNLTGNTVAGSCGPGRAQSAHDQGDGFIPQRGIECWAEAV